jgi:hypothetical protein
LYTNKYKNINQFRLKTKFTKVPYQIAYTDYFPNAIELELAGVLSRDVKIDIPAGYLTNKPET